MTERIAGGIAMPFSNLPDPEIAWVIQQVVKRVRD